jgi:hypothetical protein
MMRTINGALISLAAALISPAAQVLRSDNKFESGRNALQTGHPQIALVYLVAAAEIESKYKIPFR